MKRTPLRPGTKELTRSAPLPKQNRSRLAVLFRRQFHSPAFVRWVRSLPCVRCGAYPCDPAHVVHSKGAGGRPWHIVPLCTGPFGCHKIQHAIGIETFAVRSRLDLQALAASTWARWQEVGA